MSKASHPYFIANDPDRKTTATLLVGTADEFGIDQHDIQVTAGGFNVTEDMARALYGDDFDADVDQPAEDADEDADEDDALTGQVPVPGEPIVTGSPKSGDATTAVPVEETEVSDEDEEDDQSVAPEHSVLNDGSDAEDEDESTPDYESWDYNDLKAEVNRRQIETEDQKKATLVAALIESDSEVNDEDDDTL